MRPVDEQCVYTEHFQNYVHARLVEGTISMLADDERRVIGKLLELVDDLGVPRPDQRRHALAPRRVRRQPLAPAAMIDWKVFLKSPQHGHVDGLTTLHQVPERPHDGTQVIGVHSGDSQRALFVTEGVLHVDNDKCGFADIEEVKIHSARPCDQCPRLQHEPSNPAEPR